MGFISGSLVGGSDMGPFSCYREAAAGAGLAELAVHIGEGRFQRLAVQAVADDLFPAEDEVLGLELVQPLFLHVGFRLGPDGLGGGLQLFLLGLDLLEPLDPVLNNTLSHGVVSFSF